MSVDLVKITLPVLLKISDQVDHLVSDFIESEGFVVDVPFSSEVGSECTPQTEDWEMSRT